MTTLTIGFVNLVNWLKYHEYCNRQLHDNLEAVEDSPKATLRERAKSLNKSIKSATKKNQAEIQSKLDEAKAGNSKKRS